jgi:hypothetical protein
MLGLVYLSMRRKSLAAISYSGFENVNGVFSINVMSSMLQRNATLNPLPALINAARSEKGLQ